MHPIGYGTNLAAFVRRVGPLAVPDAQWTGRGRLSKPLSTACIMELRSRAFYGRASSVRPPRNRIPTVSDSRRLLAAKTTFERSYHLAASHRRRLATRRLGW